MPCGRIVHVPYTLELADSELRDVIREGALARLRLSAAAVRDEAGERGWLTGVSLEMSAASLHGDAAHAFGRIAEAGLSTGAGLLRRMDLPGMLAAPGADEVVTLAVRLANGAQFVVAGHRLDARLAGDARFTPDLSC
jgi:hypothetical protein